MNHYDDQGYGYDPQQSSYQPNDYPDDRRDGDVTPTQGLLAEQFSHLQMNANLNHDGSGYFPDPQGSGYAPPADHYADQNQPNESFSGQGSGYYGNQTPTPQQYDDQYGGQGYAHDGPMYSDDIRQPVAGNDAGNALSLVLSLCTCTQLHMYMYNLANWKTFWEGSLV